MSIHPTLKVKEGLLRSRNVWTRIERLQALKKASKLEEGDSVFGLPKVRTGVKQKKKPKKEKAAEGATPAGGAAPAEGGEAAAPAAAAAGGKPAGKPGGKPAGKKDK
jgi:small basic protein (TIGR04137 family)